MPTISESLAAMPPPRPSARTKRSDDIARFYRSGQRARLRYAFVKGKERRCQCCGVKASDGAEIVVDHIKPIRHFWHLRLDPGNCQLLCDGCTRQRFARSNRLACSG